VSGASAPAAVANKRFTSSDPSATATGCWPSATADTAALSAAIPDEHTPAADSSSIGPPPSRPCTIEAKPGTRTHPGWSLWASARRPREDILAVSAGILTLSAGVLEVSADILKVSADILKVSADILEASAATS
jgi:hypothetical protein